MDLGSTLKYIQQYGADFASYVVAFFDRRVWENEWFNSVRDGRLFVYSFICAVIFAAAQGWFIDQKPPTLASVSSPLAGAIILWTGIVALVALLAAALRSGSDPFWAIFVVLRVFPIATLVSVFVAVIGYGVARLAFDYNALGKTHAQYLSYVVSLALQYGLLSIYLPRSLRTGSNIGTRTSIFVSLLLALLAVAVEIIPFAMEIGAK